MAVSWPLRPAACVELSAHHPRARQHRLHRIAIDIGERRFAQQRVEPGHRQRVGNIGKGGVIVADLDMDRMAEGTQRRFMERYAQGGVDMDGAGNILQHRAHGKGEGKFVAKLADMRADGLDAQNLVIGFARDDAHEAAAIAGIHRQRARAARRFRSR